MNKYSGSYNNYRRGRWKKVFIVITLLLVAGVAAYFYMTKKNKGTEPTPATLAPAAGELAPSTPAGLAPTAPIAVASAVSTSQTRVILSDAQAAIDAGQLGDAKTTLDTLVKTTPDAAAIKLLGKVNMQMLKSPRPMPGKERYVIKSGDYLQKIAKSHKTTVALIKEINGMQTDTIRLGASIMVFNGDFSIRVSKSRNTLDLMAGDQLFKRYSVGTGKFGKTPAVEFSIVDKIVDPPWTRFSDGKQIEYGDPENVLGTRWMAIKSADHPEFSGFGIHGTWQRDSIGKQSSAGCIRMLNEDVEELFDLVPRKTTVIIVD